MTPPRELSPIAQALGRVPTGLYVVTSRDAAGADFGFVGSFVMQTGLAPPTVCVAIARDRAHLAAIRTSGVFALSILDQAKSGSLMAPFFKKPAPDATPFDQLAATRAPSGALTLTDALAWLDCRVLGEFATPDHVVVFAEVTAGAPNRSGDPAIHLRKNGLAY